MNTKIRIPVATAFMAILLAGWDVVAFSVFGGSLRLSLIILMLPLFYYNSQLLRRSTYDGDLFLFAFIFSSLFVTLGHFDAKSLVYWGHWLSIITIYYYVGRTAGRFLDGADLIKIYRNAFRIQIAVGFVVFVFVRDRAHLLYFEPSYFVLASIPFVVIAMRDLLVNMSTKGRIDALFVGVFLLITQSATLIVAIFLSVLLVLTRRPKSLAVAALFGLPIVLIILRLLPTGSDSLLAMTIHGFTQADDKLQFFLDRGGTRWYRLLLALDLAREHWLWGIGPGNIFSYLQSIDLSSYIGNRWWMNLEGAPVTNVFLELTVDVGIFPTIFTILFLVSVIYRVVARGWWEFGGSIAITILILLGMSSLFRPYVWLLLGLSMTLEPRTLKTSAIRNIKAAAPL